MLIEQRNRNHDDDGKIGNVVGSRIPLLVVCWRRSVSWFNNKEIEPRLTKNAPKFYEGRVIIGRICEKDYEGDRLNGLAQTDGVYQKDRFFLPKF